MKKLIEKIKQYLKDEDDLKYTGEKPKVQEQQQQQQFIPYVYGYKRTFIRGYDTIKFAVNYDKNKLYSFNVTLKDYRYHAYVNINYDVKKGCHSSHLDDGYINKDNGQVSSEIIGGELILSWKIGSGFTLGGYSVLMNTISASGSEEIKEDYDITICEKNYGDYWLNKVTSASNYRKKG
jgi:hypothetical protein